MEIIDNKSASVQVVTWSLYESTVVLFTEACDLTLYTSLVYNESNW